MLWDDNSPEVISNTAVYKFLGFEQILKNSLTGYPIGGGKEGVIQIFLYAIFFFVEVFILTHKNSLLDLSSINKIFA